MERDEEVAMAQSGEVERWIEGGGWQFAEGASAVGFPEIDDSADR
jgi:hypothetical protein